MCEALIRRRCEEVGTVLEDLAKDSACKALQEEGDLSKNGLYPPLFLR
jgi:hypothetical protein